jgi:hypothetical protein
MHHITQLLMLEMRGSETHILTELKPIVRNYHIFSYFVRNILQYQINDIVLRYRLNGQADVHVA